jgi:hypothetical protein
VSQTDQFPHPADRCRNCARSPHLATASYGPRRDHVDLHRRDDRNTRFIGLVNICYSKLLLVMDPIPHREVRTRRIAFRYQAGTRHQHYVAGDLVMSHAVAVLSGMFPEGEDFFVRSVRDRKPLINDPELLEQVAGFIGQEVTHGREHRDLNDRLAEMGYRSVKVDRHAKGLLALGDRLLSKNQRLAITAALEHYTATLAECLLGKPKSCSAKARSGRCCSGTRWRSPSTSPSRSTSTAQRGDPKR